MNKFIGFIYFFLLNLQVSQGQNFRYYATLDTVPKDGYYKILINPQIAGFAKASFSDIRLYDSTRLEVPYILQREQPVQYKKLFKEYTLVSRQSKPGKATTLILQNTARSKINNLALLIKNANVRKKASLSGSTDAKSWYIIDDNFTIQSVYSQSATQEVKTLDFPLSDYEFYKLEINDSLSAPINIIKVGYYDTYTENGKYTSIPGLHFTQQDSAEVKQTFIRIRFASPAHIDKLEIKVASPEYYQRQAEIWAADTITGRRRKRSVVFKSLAQSELKSLHENTINVNDFLSDDFYLVIHNGDNPPVQLEDVTAFQLNTYLVAPLKKGHIYHLQFGNTHLHAPMYDLAYFESNLPEQMPLIQAGEISDASTKATAAIDHSIFTNKLIIWAAIGVVIALLGYMSYRMITEMKRVK